MHGKKMGPLFSLQVPQFAVFDLRGLLRKVIHILKHKVNESH